MSKAGNSWVEKHRPDSWDDIQGNNKALSEIRDRIETFEPGDSPILLVGEPGTGKTSTAKVAAEHMGWPYYEINTSAIEGSDDVKEMAEDIRMTPANADRQVILLDEVDSWHHAVNKSPLAEALKSPKNPVFLTANEEYEIPDSIKRPCKKFEFKLGKRSVRAKVRKIAEKEGVDLDDEDLERLAERPDLRSAINDLQTISEMDVPPGEDGRTWEESPFSVMEKLIKGQDVRVSDGDFKNPDDFIDWVDENLTVDWRGYEATVAYEVLAEADRWEGVAQEGDYRFRAYAYALLETIPSLRLSEPYDGWMDINYPRSARQYPPRVDSESNAEAVLYRALTNYESGRYGFSGSFLYFRQVYLPILRDLPKEERMRLILDHGVPEEGCEALDVSEDDYKDFAELEEPEAGEWEPDTNSAASW